MIVGSFFQNKLRVPLRELVACAAAKKEAFFHGLRRKKQKKKLKAFGKETYSRDARMHTETKLKKIGDDAITKTSRECMRTDSIYMRASTIYCTRGSQFQCIYK